MKQTINVHDFREAFRQCGRQGQFSYAGLEVLFDYLEECEESTGEEIELDVIALCCEYAEDSPADIAESYDIDLPEREEDEDDEEHAEAVREAVLDYLNYHTSVCGVTDSGTIVYQQF